MAKKLQTGVVTVRSSCPSCFAIVDVSMDLTLKSDGRTAKQGPKKLRQYSVQGRNAIVSAAREMWARYRADLAAYKAYTLTLTEESKRTGESINDIMLRHRKAGTEVLPPKVGKKTGSTIEGVGGVV